MVNPMGRRGGLWAVVILVAAGVLAPPAARAERRPQSPPTDAPISREAVEFTVVNPADGRHVSALAYADMTGQVVDQLHKDHGGFMEVVLGGHGTGAEAAELEAG